MTNLKAVAARALPLLDLTNLDDGCTEEDIAKLCARAVTPHGNVAAVCVWPKWVTLSRKLLRGTGVKVATVVNFPAGTDTPAKAAAGTARAFGDGAHEVDIVVPYKAFLAGDLKAIGKTVGACRKVVPAGRHLKAILETSEYPDGGSICRAAVYTLYGGAHFIKTSTGKLATGATPDAAREMLGAIRMVNKRRSLKISGGVRKTADAAVYLALADEIMGPDWVNPRRFRFGASGLLDDLLATLDGKSGARAKLGY